MEVRQEDVLEVGQPDDGPLQLPLRSFGAVEEQLLAAPPQQQRRRRALSAVGIDADVPRKRRSRSTAGDLGVIALLAAPGRFSHGRPDRPRGLPARDHARALHGRSGSSTRRIRSPRTRATCPGLISTLTPDCVYELVQTGHRWEGHEGAARFYTQLLTAFPDIRFDLTDIVIGPQGVCEEADVTATHQAPWLGVEPTGERLEWKVVIWFPWDEERRLFRGEKVYVSGIAIRCAWPAMQPAA